MSLVVGQTLSFYEILGSIGAGAMGEVYRAKDTRLGREVAIKVLPEHFAEDEERLHRFEREAKLLASMNHLNVAQIFSVDQVGDTCFLVLELVPGETLAERIARGPLALEVALDVCRQIAEGLEAAHEAGVVHRDLKPANVRITPEGRVKVLDFGLAKSTGSEAGQGSSAGSVLSTEEGRLLGTPAYMAPEQACGKPIDRRVDVWAFGCVLYECLTAQRAFRGEMLSDVLAAVLQDDPDWSRLPPKLPVHVRELLVRCFVKDPRERLRDVGEARLLLGSPGTVPEEKDEQRSRPWGWVAALVSSVALVFVALYRPGHESVAALTPLRIRVPTDADGLDYRMFKGEPSPPAFSPDGSQLVYANVTGGSESPALYLRSLMAEESRALPGTALADQPFWSPDGSSLAFVAGASLQRLRLGEERSEVICELPVPGEGSEPRAGFLGGTWSETGSIVFSFGGQLYIVAASGGPARSLITPDPSRSEVGLWWPQALPGGGLLFAVGSPRSEARGLFAISLDTPAVRTRLLGDDVRARVGSQRLLFVRAGKLFSQAFDPDGRVVTGEATVLVGDVAAHPTRPGWGWFDTSASGHLVFFSRAVDDVQLHWVDRTGRSLGRVGPPGSYGQISLAPDQSRVAVAVEGPDGSDLWVMNLASGQMLRATSEPGYETFAVWAPAGNELVYTWQPEAYSSAGIWRRPLGLDEPGFLLVQRKSQVRAQQWTRDGQLLYACDGEIWFQPGAEPGRGVRLLGAKVTCGEPRITPDGRWMAYTAKETGGTQVTGTRGDWQLFVAPADRPDDPSRITLGRGHQALWRDDGEELFFLSHGGILMAVAIRDKDGRPIADPPEQLFPLTSPRTTMKQYQVSVDGQRFLVQRPAPEGKRGGLQVILNWPALIP